MGTIREELSIAANEILTEVMISNEGDMVLEKDASMCGDITAGLLKAGFKAQRLDETKIKVSKENLSHNQKVVDDPKNPIIYLEVDGEPVNFDS